MTVAATRPGAPFAGLPLPAGQQVVAVDAQIGTLTALRAAPPAGVTRRGSALLVPGFTGSKEDHRVLLPLLAERGFDAWAYSQRGQGDSAGPDVVEAYTLDRLAAEVHELAAVVRSAAARDGGDGGPVHLLGHSFGGVVASAAAVADPTAFASLTLLCSGPHGWPGRKADIRDRLLAAGGRTDLWTLDNPGLAWRIEQDPRVLDELDAEARFLRERSIATPTAQLLAAIDILADTTDVTPAIAATGLRVLVAHGEHDDLAWPQGWQRRTAEQLGARYVVLADAGHLPNLEAPTATADLLAEFWAG